MLNQPLDFVTHSLISIGPPIGAYLQYYIAHVVVTPFLSQFPESLAELVCVCVEVVNHLCEVKVRLHSPQLSRKLIIMAYVFMGVALALLF